MRRAMAAIARVSGLLVDESELDKPRRCHACGTLTEKQLVEYEHRYTCNDSTIVTITKILPGYRCPSCGVEYLDEQIHDRFLEAIALTIAGLANDDRLLDSLTCEGRDPAVRGTFTPLPFASDAHR